MFGESPMFQSEPLPLGFFREGCPDCSFSIELVAYDDEQANKAVDNLTAILANHRRARHRVEPDVAP